MWLEIFLLAASDRAGVERESKANVQLGNISCAGEPSAPDIYRPYCLSTSAGT